MSDYAGPILGAVGAVIGGWATGWVNPAGYQWGWAIGPAVGSLAILERVPPIKYPDAVGVLA